MRRLRPCVRVRGEWLVLLLKRERGESEKGLPECADGDAFEGSCEVAIEERPDKERGQEDVDATACTQSVNLVCCDWSATGTS